MGSEIGRAQWRAMTEGCDIVRNVEGTDQAQAVVEGNWLRPALTGPHREPRWGHSDGLQLGLDPAHGPRGLLRLYAPYLDHPRDRLVNFVAIEPIPAGAMARGFSEMETSRLDGVQGLRFWSADDANDPTPGDALDPSRGAISVIDGVEHLEVNILSEPFANGSDVWVRATFRSDRPHEIALATFARASSVPLESCILSATMGNWARLRVLRLAERDVRSGELWPEYRESAFTAHARFGVSELRAVGGEVAVSAFPDEADPSVAEYASGTAAGWHYIGRPAVQTWRAAEPDPQLFAQVNGRFSYWMSDAPIPGGISFENFEFVEPFRQGRSFTFAVEPLGVIEPRSAAGQAETSP